MTRSAPLGSTRSITLHMPVDQLAEIEATARLNERSVAGEIRYRASLPREQRLPVQPSDSNVSSSATAPDL